jgi:kynurenine formamidase
MGTHLLRGFAVALTVAIFPAQQGWHPPTDAQRCPSKWGAADQRGAANLMTPALVLQASRLIKSGEVFELSYPISERSHGGRRYEVYTKRTDVGTASNQPQNNEELIVADLGHIGTQLDGFAHQAIGNSMYNCFKIDETATRTGLTKLGVENIGSLFTRGVLIDVAGLKGVDALPVSYEITVQDLEQALKRENLTLRAGDAVAINTGYGLGWGTQRNANAVPGIGIEAAEWLAKQEPMLVGTDTPNVEVLPSPDPKLFVPVHQIMLTVNGIYLLENLKLDELAARRAYEFAFVVQPLKLVGVTGSPIAPIAIR